MNLLFVCSRNQWRSPTAEEIYKNNSEHQVRSAGTESGARIKLTARLVSWADIIFVMEKKHKQRITEKFPDKAWQSEIVVLDTMDHYQFMDPELMDMIQISVAPYLDDHNN
ncbi:protein tyrosine phosphatase [Dyadobacter sp. LHD-138]|uniref:low molecular weight protein tyrosine phosphatase family protein n=1 Tax=Dyadobacter sp. LHD-138 TaxID=3071413 RepID=UPI0027E1C42C|nr:protein tyrosine phosphatase [Dyadobacter sp. LHD-138]MDQ6481510.1 protein tyrosine phosphatase [Dyadobacter sp. LHD-138]